MSAYSATDSGFGRDTLASLRMPQSEAAMPWWSSPMGVSLGFIIPIILLTVVAGEGDMQTLTIRGIRFLNFTALAVVAGMISLAALGGWLGSQVRWTGGAQGSPGSSTQWDGPVTVLGMIAIAAYVIWFREYLFNPVLMWSILTGPGYTQGRDNSMLTPGVTSLVNVAPVFFSVYAYRTLLSGEGQVRRRMHITAAVLVFFTLFRAQVWSERLSVIEVAVPVGLALASKLMTKRHVLARAICVGGPYLALPLVILLFGAAEYTRSWTSDTYNGKSGFWEFAIGRLVSYYYTSLNNGAGMLATLDWPTYRFDFTLAWLRSAPLGVGPLFTEAVGPARGIDVFQFLRLYADPEFNSPSGVASALVDLGVPLAVLYMFFMGFFSGVLFRAYCDRRLVGILLYPMCFIAFLEVLRYLYFGQPRAFTAVVGAVLVMGFLRIAQAVQEWRVTSE